MANQYTIEHYLTEDGMDFFADWFRSLRDPNAKARVTSRLDRVEHGNFGDHKLLEEGVWALRIDYGPGYRIYYCFDGRAVVILLCGGDKTSQKADIKQAMSRKADYERRKRS